jgi:hypothetical protein
MYLHLKRVHQSFIIALFKSIVFVSWCIGVNALFDPPAPQT